MGRATGGAATPSRPLRRLPGERRRLEVAKARLDRLAYYPDPVRLNGVRILVAPAFFRLPPYRRFRGFTLIGTILVRDADVSDDLIAHELCHVWQMQHAPVQATVAWFRYPYRQNPYEIEARKAVADTKFVGVRQEIGSAMDRRPLGRTGLEVSRVILGCGNFGGVGSAPQFFGQGESRDEAFAVMDAAVAHGITVFDTADAYGGGRSERWVGEWIAERGRSDVLVTTKVFHSVEGNASDLGLTPDRIRRQVEGSLRRLRRDSLDLYMTHAWDAETPIGDTLGAFDGLVRAGLVRAVGASNIWGEQLEQALAASAEHGLVRFEWVQNPYSLLDRTAEREVLPICEREGLGFTPFGPLEGGWLTGKYRRGAAPPVGSRMTLRPEPYAHLDTEQVYRGIERLEAEAARRGVSLAALALAWVLSHPLVAATIVGPRRPEHFDVVRDALELELTADERAAIADLIGDARDYPVA